MYCRVYEGGVLMSEVPVIESKLAPATNFRASCDVNSVQPPTQTGGPQNLRTPPSGWLRPEHQMFLHTYKSYMNIRSHTARTCRVVLSSWA